MGHARGWGPPRRYRPVGHARGRGPPRRRKPAGHTRGLGSPQKVQTHGAPGGEDPRGAIRARVPSGGADPWGTIGAGVPPEGANLQGTHRGWGPPRRCRPGGRRGRGRDGEGESEHEGAALRTNWPDVRFSVLTGQEQGRAAGPRSRCVPGTGPTGLRGCAGRPVCDLLAAPSSVKFFPGPSFESPCAGGREQGNLAEVERRQRRR